jgi:hypothetical protein
MPDLSPFLVSSFALPQRRALVIALAASAVFLAACFDAAPRAAGDGDDAGQKRSPPSSEESPPLPAGSYPIQSISYDDATGAYAVFLLEVPAGHKPLYRTEALRLARLEDADVAAGKQAELVVAGDAAEGGAPVARLAPDFKIDVTHNVVEERADPRTGEVQPVVVAQQTSSWSPFLAGMTGAMVGNMLFAPRYYYPPPYTGGPMVGFGGAGPTRDAAMQDHRQKTGALPQPARLSKSGWSKAPAGSSLKPSGVGAGSSRLRSAPPTSPRPKAKPFGGGGFRRRR